MATRPPVQYRTIEVSPTYLPFPATRLVLTQYLSAHRDPPFWAWLIVGAFYDSEENIIWSTEIFAGHLDIQLDTDDEESESEQSLLSEEESVAACTSTFFPRLRLFLLWLAFYLVISWIEPLSWLYLDLPYNPTRLESG